MTAYRNTYYLLLDAALADIGHVLRKVDGAALRRLREMIRTTDRVVVAGEGCVGLAMQMFALHLTDLGLHAAALGEVSDAALTDGDLLLIGSAVGEEVALMQQAEHIRAHGARVALMTGAVVSPLTAHADHAVVLNLPPQAERGLFAQVLVVLLDLQRVQLAGDLARAAGAAP